MMFSINARRVLKRFATLAVPLVTALAVAQAPAEMCTTIVQAALEAADQACSSTGRNQVCYGNILGDAVPADGVTELNFADVGDIEQVQNIQSLHLSPLDEATQQWGVALMQLQANLPDTLPGQNVTFLLFGDVEIEEALDDQVRVPAQALRATNIRLRPSVNSEVLGALPRGAEVLVTGKYLNSAGEVWLRVKYEQYRTRTGWAYGNLFDIQFSELPDVSPDSLVLNPMQAFYFRTGIGRSTCAEAPTSGVVVQTPEGAGLVNFSVNGVDISLGSTAVLSSSESELLNVALLEGVGSVEIGGLARQLVPGAETRIERRASDSPNSEPVIPSLPVPISRERYKVVSQVLSIAPRKITLPEPATRDAIERVNPLEVGGGVIAIDIQVPGCPQGTPPEQCACNDVDGDGICDAVPCSERFPTMCIPGCRDNDGDGKCDVQCPDRNGDGRCDVVDDTCPDLNNDGRCDTLPCIVGSIGCECEDSNNNAICDNLESTASCLLPGPVACDPTCTNVDGDATCDAFDPCIDADGDGLCDILCNPLVSECPPIVSTRTPTPIMGSNPTRTPTPSK